VVYCLLIKNIRGTEKNCQTHLLKNWLKIEKYTADNEYSKEHVHVRT